MNDTKTLTDIVASEIINRQHQDNASFDEVVDEMNLPWLAIRICQFHELQVKREDISAVCIGAVALAQISMFPDMYYLDGVTHQFKADTDAKLRKCYTEMELEYFGIAI